MYSEEDVSHARKEYREAKLKPGWKPSIYLYGEEVAYYYGQRADHYAETFLVHRFFDTIVGFHTGSLDLAGRHEKVLDLSVSWNVPLTTFQKRYRKHMELWETFVMDAHRLSPTIVDSVNLRERAGDIQTKLVPVFDMPFEELCATWNMPIETITYQWITSQTDRVIRILQLHPHAKIQKLLFLDLPVEIIDRVFESGDLESGQLLSATCQCLHRIALRHIFQERCLRFEAPPGYYEGINHNNDPLNYTVTAAESSRTKLLASAKLLSDYPAIPSQIRKLELSDCWNGTPLYFDNPRLVGFYIPLQSAWLSGMTLCKNVTILELKSILIDPRFVDSICGMHQLHTIILECPASPIIIDHLLSQPGKSLPSVRIVRMSMKRRGSSTDLWPLLVLFPGVQSLSVQQTLTDHWSSQRLTSGFLQAPPQRLWGKANLSSLENLSLSNIYPLALDQISRWLKHETPMINLKQLRFYSCYGIDDAKMTSFLETFSASPLQLLVINGVSEGGNRLFRVLPTYFPVIRGLMVLRRASPRQLHTRESPWPLQPFDYARHLASLPELRYFGWNRKDNQYWYLASRPLLRFEQDFVTENESVSAFDPCEDLWEDEDDNWTAKMFAQACPKIQAYTNEFGSIRGIERFEDGQIRVRRQGERGSWLGLLPGFSSSNFGYSYWEPMIPDILVPSS